MRTKTKDRIPNGAVEQKDREAVLSVLEEDQLFAAKQAAELGRAQLSPGTRILMWCLRAYVILMIVSCGCDGHTSLPRERQPIGRRSACVVFMTVIVVVQVIRSFRQTN